MTIHLDGSVMKVTTDGRVVMSSYLDEGEVRAPYGQMEWTTEDVEPEPPAPGPGYTPGDVVATPTVDGFELAWTAPADPVDSYEVRIWDHNGDGQPFYVGPPSGELSHVQVASYNGGDGYYGYVIAYIGAVLVGFAAFGNVVPL